MVTTYGTTLLTFNDDIIRLFVPRSEVDTNAGEDIEARTDQAVLVMLEAEELFTPEALQVIWNASERLKDVEGVVSVASLYDLRTPKTSRPAKDIFTRYSSARCRRETH